jgi:hypothetical protein
VKTSSLLFCVTIWVVLAAKNSSAQAVAVGNCRPHLVSYSTISAAVAAVTPSSTVLVCPGTYPEQVTITQPLTLKGLNLGTGGNPIIAVPSGGLVGKNPAQLSAQQQTGDLGQWGPVNLSNIVVDGVSSGFDCSNGTLIGIEYVFASGSLDNVEVRNQNPGGCGFGMQLVGAPYGVATVNVRHSYIHDFDNTGIFAVSGGASGFFVNLTSNLVASVSASVQAGVEYGLTDGVTEQNTIVVSGPVGLFLSNFFTGMKAKENTISGSNVGILSAGNEGGPTIIAQNSLFNNGTGIAFIGAGGGAVVNSNFIVQSSVAAIDLGVCSGQDVTAENNIIFSASVGIANIASGDTIERNTFFSVPTLTTTCP